MPTSKTKTSPSGLTPEEQQELERKGFFIKKTYTFYQIFHELTYLNYIIHFVFLLLILSFYFLARSGNFFFSVLSFSIISIFSVFLWRFLLIYVKSGTIFTSDFVRIELGKLHEGIEGYKSNFFNFIDRPIRSYIKYSCDDKRGIFIPIVGLSIVLSVILQAVLWEIGFFSTYNINEISSLLFLFIGISLSIVIHDLGISLVLYYLRACYQSFHPLYAFGNLGSKIQSLTPCISETSEKIEQEFSQDMNFRTLSNSFDTLAKDFSQISSYVIRLEQIEKKANKGNLFDSEKYIGSLREDVVRPLTALRAFLKTKEIELQSSQEEIKKVRVKVGGGGSGESENLELQSKRSEPLIQELRENIEKLGWMIEKFGKI